MFSPMAAARADSEDAAPETGTRGTITAARVGAGLRTYLYGPGGGLVFVEWDSTGLVSRVSLRDLTLEPEDDPSR
jgi:hypothetical protein